MVKTLLSTKSNFLFFIIFLGGIFIQSQVSAQTVFWSEDFETDGTGTRYIAPNQFIDDTLGSGGSEDYYGRIENTGTILQYVGCATAQIDQTTPVSGQSGSFFMAGEDLDDPTGTTFCGAADQQDIKTLEFLAANGHDINITGASVMTFKILVAVGTSPVCNTTNARWDSGEGLKVIYSKDGGVQDTALCFSPDISCGTPSTSNEPLKTDPNCDGNGTDGVIVPNVFTEYSFTIPPGGSSLELRVVIDADAADEEIAFDNLRLEAITIPTPITMGDLVATPIGNKVRLNWETLSEMNSDYFSIERSHNGENFNPIGAVKAAGNSTGLLNYLFEDTNPYSGNSYYRIKLIDIDGTYAYSKTVTVTANLEADFSLAPNPTTGEVSVVGVNKDINYAVLDCTGRKVQSGRLNNSKFEIAELPSGLYFVELNLNGKLSVQRLIKK